VKIPNTIPNKIVYSITLLFTYLDSQRFMWGERSKTERLITIGWDARQPEINELRQEVSDLNDRLDDQDAP